MTEYLPVKTRWYPRPENITQVIFLSLQALRPLQKVFVSKFKLYSIQWLFIFEQALQNNWRIINTIASILVENMFKYISLDIRSFRILEQVMSANKNQHLFSRQIRAIVYIALHGHVKFRKGKHCANLGVHIVVKRCIVTQTAVYGCSMYWGMFSMVWCCM